MPSIKGRGWVNRSVALVAAAAIIGNGLRLRRRLAALPVLAAGDPAGAGAGSDAVDPAGYVAVHVDGGALPGAVLLAAAGHLRVHGLEALDLLPGDLPVEELLDHLRISDPVRLRANPIFLAFGAGQAVVMTRNLAERAGVAGGAADTVDVRRAFGQAKRYAPQSVDQVVAPALAAVPLTADQNLAVWRTQYGRPLPMIVATRLASAAAAAALVALDDPHRHVEAVAEAGSKDLLGVRVGRRAHRDRGVAVDGHRLVRGVEPARLIGVAQPRVGDRLAADQSAEGEAWEQVGGGHADPPDRRGLVGFGDREVRAPRRVLGRVIGTGRLASAREIWPTTRRLRGLSIRRPPPARSPPRCSLSSSVSSGRVRLQAGPRAKTRVRSEAKRVTSASWAGARGVGVARSWLERPAGPTDVP